MSYETSPKVARKMADNLMKHVKGWLHVGLPDCYKNFEDQMDDFYPDLPWDHDGLIVACQHILDNHGNTLDEVKKKFKFDLRKSLKSVTKDTRK